MRVRDFATVSPTFYRERASGAFLVSHERYRGLFAGEHSHPEAQIQVFLKGRIHLQVGEARQLLGPGSVLVMPAGIAHASLHLDDDLELINVMAPADWIDSVEREIGQGSRGPEGADWGSARRPTLLEDGAQVQLKRPSSVGSPKADTVLARTGAHRTMAEPFLWALAQRMAQALEAGGSGGDRVLAAGLELIGLTLAEPPAKAARGKEHGDQDPRIAQAVARILRDCGEPLMVEALAQDAAMTPRHFDRCFKAAVGVSPKRFILATRIRVARDLLERTRSSITEIALDVGFGDATHFIRTFRAAMGETPSRWRSLHRSATAG